VIYLDSSCLLKLLLEEPESAAVREAVDREDEVVVSSLTELETTVQLHAGWRSGEFRERRYRTYLAQVEMFRSVEPFRFRSLPGTVFQTALRQHRIARDLHCRSLNRLHLAAMEELDLRRLMTNDRPQAIGARALGFKVLAPGRPGC
jgi:predicted nucleic acid-binding protein